MTKVRNNVELLKCSIVVDASLGTVDFRLPFAAFVAFHRNRIFFLLKNVNNNMWLLTTGKFVVIFATC